MLFLTQHVELTSHGCVRQEIAIVNRIRTATRMRGQHEIERVGTRSHFSEYAKTHEIARVKDQDSETLQATRQMMRNGCEMTKHFS